MRTDHTALIFTALLALLFSACSSRVTGTSNTVQSPDVLPSAFMPRSDETTEVSIKQLLDNPKQYDGKFIRVIGYVYLEFEGNIISNGPDKKYKRPVRDVWLKVSDEIKRERDKYNEKYVLVEGTFNAKEHGHMGLSIGTIENIKRFEVVKGKA